MANIQKRSRYQRCAQPVPVGERDLLPGTPGSITAYKDTTINNYLVVTALTWVLLLTACTSERSPEQAAPSVNDPHHLLSTGGVYTIDWKSIPAPIPLNSYFDLDVFVSQPLKPLHYDVNLEVNAGMLAHNHGMHTMTRIEKLERSHFRVRGMLFHMPGEWHVTFRVARGEMIELAGIDIRI